MNALQTIDFHGDDLAALRTEDGKIMVSVRHVCDSLGINTETQTRKLKGCKWATTVEMTVVAGDGKMRETTMIDHESLPMWMMTIRPNKVSLEVREKLEHYQLEAKQVLADHFLGKATPPQPVDHILVMLQSALETRKAQLALEQRQAELEAAVSQVGQSAVHALEKAEEAGIKALAAQETVTGAADYMALVGFARIKGLKKTEQELSREGIWFSKYCENHGIPIKKIPHQKYGKQNAYDVEALEKCWWPVYCQRNGISVN